MLLERSGKMKRKLKKTPVIILILCVFVGGLFIFFYQRSVVASKLAQEEADRIALLTKAEELEQGYFYEEALTLLNSRPELNNETLEAKKASLQDKKEHLVLYEGPIHHIFFHSLIVHPEMAFDGDYTAEGYNYWMVTNDEFKKMLDALYQRNYVLYDIQSFIEANPEQPGKIRKADIYVPEGKIPLVLSIDDVSYYNYMGKDGFARKLIVDEQDKIATIVRNEAGEFETTYDGDVMPIVDQFVLDHPDFSYRGAKGILALTGYEGVFGYRITDLEGDALKEAQQEATAVADCLKRHGWRFASHSYTHNGFFKTGKITMDELIYDTERWEKYIQPVLGATNIYISPFGVHFSADDERYRYLVEKGFQIYCPVDSSLRILDRGDNIVMPRVAIDGLALWEKPKFMSTYYFNVEEIRNSLRPEI